MNAEFADPAMCSGVPEGHVDWCHLTDGEGFAITGEGDRSGGAVEAGQGLPVVGEAAMRQQLATRYGVVRPFVGNCPSWPAAVSGSAC
jgi:hypothetical protein